MTHKFKVCPWGSQPDRSERAKREVVANEPRYEKYKQTTRKKDKRERERKKQAKKGDDVDQPSALRQTESKRRNPASLRGLRRNLFSIKKTYKEMTEQQQKCCSEMEIIKKLRFYL